MRRPTRFTIEQGWKIVLSDFDLNPADVLKLAQLPGDLFARKDAFVTAPEYFRLWQALETIAGADDLPLRIGQSLSLETFSPAIFASICSPNLNSALERLSRYKTLVGPMVMTVDVLPQRTCATFGCYGNEGPVPSSLGATEAVFLTQLVRLATRKRIVPLRLELTQLPANRELYLDYFNVEVKLGKLNRITFSAQDALQPFFTENAVMWNYFEAFLQRRLSDLDESAVMSLRVRGALLEMLPSGQSAIEEVARRLAVSKRTLQRALAEERASYQQILNSLRKELAEHYLAKSSTSSGEISFLLGFQDNNSFLRAFNAWTGSSPAAYRRLRRQ